MVSPDKKTDSGSDSSQQYEHISTGTIVPVGNIKASKMKISGGDLFMVMMGNYTFIANSLDTLRSSLKSATHPTASLKSKKGMKEVYKNLDEDRLLVYRDFSTGLPGPAGRAVIGSKGAVFLFTVKEDEPLSADIFAIDQEDKKEAPLPSGFSWHSKIHAGSMITFTSSRNGISEFMKELKDMEGPWKSVTASMEKFMAAGKIKEKN